MEQRVYIVGTVKTETLWAWVNPQSGNYSNVEGLVKAQDNCILGMYSLGVTMFEPQRRDVDKGAGVGEYFRTF